MIIDLIFKKYDGRIKLNNPIVCGDNGIPELLREILQKTNGIQETMIHPKTGEQIEIGWIVYSYDEMIRATNYYRNEYGLSGTVFSDDGAGNPYYILDDKIYEYDPIDTLAAGCLFDCSVNSAGVHPCKILFACHCLALLYHFI